MTSSKQFGLALDNWFKSWNFIFKNRLAHFFLYPILVSILLSIGATKFIKYLVSLLMDYVHQFLGIPEGEIFDSFSNFFHHLSHNLIEWSAWLLGIVIFWKISKYVTLALMSPVMSILSSKTLECIEGKTTPFDFGQFIKDILRGITLSIRNLFAELFMNLLLFALNIMVAFIFAPAEIILSPLTWFVSILISAYYSGFSTMDYALENKRFTYSQSVAFIRKNFGLAIGNGLPYALIFRIPFLGPSIAIVTCTVAGTILVSNNKFHTKISGE